jgi:predicted dinucleotide-binding enzyme
MYVKSLIGGPVANAFNTNFARLYDQLGKAAEKPSMVFAADEDARHVTETLIGDAGYEPVYAGDLSNARIVRGLSMSCWWRELSGTLEARSADGRAGCARAP